MNNVIIACNPLFWLDGVEYLLGSEVSLGLFRVDVGCVSIVRDVCHGYLDCKYAKL